MIGIITITSGANYGNRLQNYAVKSVLKKLGYCSETIVIDGSRDKTIKKFFKNLIKKVIKYHNYLLSLRIQIFNRYSKIFLNDIIINSKNSLDSIEKNYKIFLCGSDQIWNLHFDNIRSNMNFFFANFAPKEKRIAYSASIGSEDIPDECKADFIRLVQEMKAISVREENARDVIKTLTGRDVPVTVDPTLMLGKSEWLEIAKKPKYVKKNKRFILTYFLGEYSSEVEAYITTISQTYNFQVINLYNEHIEPSKIKNKDYFCTDPSEFIWLISNCELVMTDSFHGCIFSMIMDKPFRCFSRMDSESNMSSRMDTLFKKFNVSDWCIGDINEDVEHVFYKDYSDFESTLKKEQDFAYDYLKGALDIK